MPANQHEPNDLNAHERNHPVSTNAKNNIKARASMFHSVLESIVQPSTQPINNKQSETPVILEKQLNNWALLYGQRSGCGVTEHLRISSAVFIKFDIEEQGQFEGV